MIYDYFMNSMMWYKTDPNPMCYIWTQPVLANLLEWDLWGVIKKTEIRKTRSKRQRVPKRPDLVLSVVLEKNDALSQCFISVKGGRALTGI